MEESQQHPGAQAPGSTERELARLQAYSAEFRRLTELRDRTPRKWQHFQHEWLWFYTRGLIAGAWPEEVYAKRMAELNASTEKHHAEEAAKLRRHMGERIRFARPTQYVKAEFVGGPLDGSEFYVRIPARAAVYRLSRDVNGNRLRLRYRRRNGSIGESLAIPSADLKQPKAELIEVLDRSFATPSIKYDYVPLLR